MTGWRVPPGPAEGPSEAFEGTKISDVPSEDVEKPDDGSVPITQDDVLLLVVSFLRWYLAHTCGTYRDCRTGAVYWCQKIL